MSSIWGLHLQFCIYIFNIMSLVIWKKHAHGELWEYGLCIHSGIWGKSSWRTVSCSVHLAQSPQKLNAWSKVIQPCRGQIWSQTLLSDTEKNKKVKVAQSYLTLCHPMDYTVLGILQPRILEWIAFPSPRDLPNPGVEPRSPTLQVDSLPAEPQGNPTILEWVAYPFSRGSSQPRNWTMVSCITGRLLTSWISGKPIWHLILYQYWLWQVGKKGLKRLQKTSPFPEYPFPIIYNALEINH